jgi:hypothetical protein
MFPTPNAIRATLPFLHETDTMQLTGKILLLLVLMTQIVGCKGCNPVKPPKTQAEIDKEREEAKKKQRILADDVRALPCGSTIEGVARESNFVKPGHWYQANNRFRANLEDESLTASLVIQDRDGKKVPFLQGQPSIEFLRNFSLAKGQDKNIRMQFFQPEVAIVNKDDLDNSNVSSMAMLQLNQRNLGSLVSERPSSAKTLAGYQYNLVTLSRNPAQFAFWKSLDCIIWNSKSRFTNERIAPHIIIDLAEDQFATHFPDRLFAMTSISHLVVNDASLATMSREQQEAVQDWLYFGGTIILNGPESIAGIESSFLKSLAPIVNTSSSTLSANEIDRLNQRWSIKIALGKRVPVTAQRPVQKLNGQLAEDAQWVPFLGDSGDVNALEGLVAERLIGQGRIVMTTFPMQDKTFTNWPSYSSFIHNVILRKPYRDVTIGDQADTKFASDMRDTELNPLHSTRLRLWARDLDNTTAELKRDPNASERSSNRKLRISDTKRTSLGAWNSDAMVLKQARSSLQESSGISVPKISTVIRLLVGYLIVLVPLNWLVFRLFGRVELAWVAAPIIALVGAFVVARSVQLDVGFSRSETSQGFLECHASHPRGLLSKYTALYTSLSTSYSAIYENDLGVVLPLPASATQLGGRRATAGVDKLEYGYANDSGSGLRSVSILSNTTGLLHSEETIDMQGAFDAKFTSDLSRVTATSNLAFPIRDVGMVGLDEDGNLITGWLGTFERNTSIEAKLEQPTTSKRWRPEWDRKPNLSAPNVLRADDLSWTDIDMGEDLYLGALLNQFLMAYPLSKGEVIAMGWTEEGISNLKISPASLQKKERTVVLLHLHAGALTPTRPDEKIFQRQDPVLQGNDPQPATNPETEEF